MAEHIRFQFQEQGVVVTGGAQGIGYQIARDFLEAGARVSIWDYSTEALKAAEVELGKLPGVSGRLQTTQADVGLFASCQAAAASLPFPIHILVNNAGITRDKSFVKMTPEDFGAVIQTNLTGVFNVTKSLFDSFVKDGPRRIISLSSVVALYGNFGQTNYVAAKAGVIGMTRTLARELGRKGFTVNAIAPGFIQTRLTDQMPPEAIAQMVARVSVARMGQVQDIAKACLFLASREASYINGTVLSVDGGLVT